MGSRAAAERLLEAGAVLVDGRARSKSHKLAGGEEIAAASDNHLAETATATLGREIDYTLGENSGHVLEAIDSALKRIEEGTYGTCVGCGEQIRYERLEATPWAALCIDCKRKAESG